MEYRSERGRFRLLTQHHPQVNDLCQLCKHRLNVGEAYSIVAFIDMAGERQAGYAHEDCAYADVLI